MDKEKQTFWDSVIDIPSPENNKKGLDWLTDLYLWIETMRLNIWEKIQETQEFYLDRGLISEGEKVANSRATYDGDMLKIVIDDYLPRKAVFNKRNTAASMNFYWTKSINKALEQLRKQGINPKYDKALIKIITYVPSNREWDVDNRVYKILIDGLRYTQVITGDTWDRMAFMVIGGVDKTNPRTEIVVNNNVNI